MPTLAIKVKGFGSIADLIDMDVAVDIGKQTLIRQRQELFRSKGRSDGGKAWPDHRGDASRQVLTDTGKLRDLVEFEVTKRPTGFTIAMFSAPGLELISNVHQFGTKIGKDIVPRSAKALFIPTSGRGAKSSLNISLGRSVPGGSTVAIPKHVPGKPAFGKRIRTGSKGNRRGKSPTPVTLRSPQDFVLVSRIPATAEKDNRAIQQRQHFRVTKKSAQEIIGNILAGSQRRR